MLVRLVIVYIMKNVLYIVIDVVIVMICDWIEVGVYLVGSLLLVQCQFFEELEISCVLLCEVLLMFEVFGMLCICVGKGVYVESVQVLVVYLW